MQFFYLKLEGTLRPTCWAIVLTETIYLVGPRALRSITPNGLFHSTNHGHSEGQIKHGSSAPDIHPQVNIIQLGYSDQYMIIRTVASQVGNPSNEWFDYNMQAIWSKLKNITNNLVGRAYLCPYKS